MDAVIVGAELGHIASPGLPVKLTVFFAKLFGRKSKRRLELQPMGLDIGSLTRAKEQTLHRALRAPKVNESTIKIRRGI